MTGSASIHDQLQEILRCPITKGSLRSYQPEELRKLNDRIAKEGLTHLDGTSIHARMEAGFVSSDGRFFYPVIEEILILLPNLAIPLTGPDELSQKYLGADKKMVQDFYDQAGWQKKEQDGASVFTDARKWEDLRPVVSEYLHNCHLRVNRYIKNQGVFLLDAGSGPVQYQEYLTYSEGYQYRICVDLSWQALKEAKKKLGDKGVCILGDITNLPLQDNSVDGAVSLHVIYHVPKDEQVNAIREIHRALKPDSSAALVYSWRKSILMERLLWYRRTQKAIQRGIRNLKSFIKTILKYKRQPQKNQPVSGPDKPYRYSHDQEYFESQLSGMDFKIFVWRSVSVPFLRAYIHAWLFGAAIMRWIYRLEEKDPQHYGQIGQYPLFVITKRSTS